MGRPCTVTRVWPGGSTTLYLPADRGIRIGRVFVAAACLRSHEWAFDVRHADGDFNGELVAHSGGSYASPRAAERAGIEWVQSPEGADWISDTLRHVDAMTGPLPADLTGDALTKRLAANMRVARGPRTQEAWAELLGMSRAGVTMIETGRNRPSLDTLLRAARITGTTVDRLLTAPPTPETVEAQS